MMSRDRLTFKRVTDSLFGSLNKRDDETSSVMVFVLVGKETDVKEAEEFLNTIDQDQFGCRSGRLTLSGMMNGVSHTGTEPSIEVKLEDLKHCPKCGTVLGKKNFHITIDSEQDEEYRWVKCDVCGWTEEG